MMNKADEWTPKVHAACLSASSMHSTPSVHSAGQGASGTQHLLEQRGVGLVPRVQFPAGFLLHRCAVFLGALFIKLHEGDAALGQQRAPHLQNGGAHTRVGGGKERRALRACNATFNVPRQALFLPEDTSTPQKAIHGAKQTFKGPSDGLSSP